MSINTASICSKLTEAELAFLKEVHGVELRDPEIAAAISQYEDARSQILAIEEKMLRRERAKNDEPPHCSFCDGNIQAVGPMAQSNRGPLICHACAVTSAAIIQQARDDA